MLKRSGVAFVSGGACVVGSDLLQRRVAGSDGSLSTLFDPQRQMSQMGLVMWCFIM